MAIGKYGVVTHYEDAKHAVKKLGNLYSIDRIRRCAVKNNNVENGQYKYGDYIGNIW